MAQGTLQGYGGLVKITPETSAVRLPLLHIIRRDMSLSNMYCVNCVYVSVYTTTCSPLHRSWTVRNRRVATLLVSDLPLPDDFGLIGTSTHSCGVNV